MIKFEGFLTGDANKFFIKKMLNRGSVFLIVLLMTSLPLWGILSINVGAFWEVMTFFLVSILLSPFIFRLCVSQKERRRNILKKVIINDDVITAVSDKSVISNNISEVKEVQDHGEFYYVVLPCKYVSSICVCQKELLSTGTIEDFESLFEHKIVRK